MNFKVKLSKTDAERIKRQQERNSVHVFLRNKTKINFNVGDVLIRKTKEYYPSEKIRVETVSPSSNAPKKFVCIHVDQFGVPFVKHMKVNGDLVDDIINVATMDLDRCWFEVDPEYVDGILLGNSVDPLQKFNDDRERRKKIKEANRKLRQKTNSREDVLAIIDKLSIGSIFWTSRQRDACIDIFEHKVIRIKEIKASQNAVGNLWGNMAVNSNYVTTQGGTNAIVELEVLTNGSQKEFMSETDLWRNNVFLTRPTSVRDE